RGSVLVWVRLWTGTQTSGVLELGPARWIGLPVLIIGVGGLLWCIWDFGRRGKGTLAPVDPPRFVVRGGLYRFVRNPMYLSVLIALAGADHLSHRSNPSPNKRARVEVTGDIAEKPERVDDRKERQ